MNSRRVVITGMGVITPIGQDLEKYWSNLQNGVSGIDCIKTFDASAFDTRIGGEVKDFDPKLYFKNPKDVRRTDRFGGDSRTEGPARYLSEPETFNPAGLNRSTRPVSVAFPASG